MIVIKADKSNFWICYWFFASIPQEKIQTQNICVCGQSAIAILFSLLRMRHCSLSKEFRSNAFIKTTAWRENISALALIVLTDSEEAQGDHRPLPDLRIEERATEHQEPSLWISSTRLVCVIIRPLLCMQNYPKFKEYFTMLCIFHVSKTCVDCSSRFHKVKSRNFRGYNFIFHEC